MNVNNRRFYVLIASGVPRFSTPQVGGFEIYHKFTHQVFVPGMVQTSFSIYSMVEPISNKEGTWK